MQIPMRQIWMVCHLPYCQIGLAKEKTQTTLKNDTKLRTLDGPGVLLDEEVSILGMANKSLRA
jgi:hypothetical protein